LSAAPADEPGQRNHHILMLFHAGSDARHFVFPPMARNFEWRLFLNTAAESPDDVFPGLDGPSPTSGVVTMEARSMAVFVADETPLV
jgi:isoamylase